MELNTIESDWTGYARLIFEGVKPSKIQVDETKKAFYAGAMCILYGFQIIGDDSVNEEEGVQWMKDRWDEAHDFCNATIMRETHWNSTQQHAVHNSCTPPEPGGGK